MASEYVSLAEIGEELGLSVRTLRYWAARDMLPGAVQFGRTWRVRVADYAAWKAEKHQKDTKGVWTWPSYTSAPEARTSTRGSTSTVNYEESALAKRFEERLKRRQTPRKSASAS